MKKILAVTGFLLLIWSSCLVAGEYKYKTIAVPDAISTMSFGINDLGDVVGTFTDDVGPYVQRFQAFLYSDGQYYDLGVDGANTVVAWAINRDGVIAGGLILDGRDVGFIRGEQTTVVLDGATRAEGINNKGAVVGFREVGAINQQAYKYKDGVYTAVTTLGYGSAATGISGKNVVGYYIGATVQGFIIKSGVLEPTEIIPLGVNRDGVLVGLSGAGSDGAVLENGVVTLIKYPGADYTQVHGINNKGHIVGYYRKAGQIFGFIAKPVSPNK